MKKIHILENVRGFAAAYVVMYHLSEFRISVPSPIKFIFSFGQEAVMLFFLLSGFVIYYSFNRHPDQPFQHYFRRRAIRIFPIYLTSLLLTYLAACLDQRTWVGFSSVLSIGNFFMLQDVADIKPGVWFSSPGNTALWSLAYEWWFYMLFFPIIRFVEAEKQLWVAAALSLLGFISYLAFPNQIGLYLMYFITWWMGVEVAKIYVKGSRPSLKSLKLPLSIFALFPALQFAYVVYWKKILGQPIHLGGHPFLEFRHFIFCFLVIVFSVALSPGLWKAVDRLLSPFGVLAPFSYALYVFHMPLCIGASYLSSIGSQGLQLALYLGITLLFAYIAEVPLQRFVTKKLR